MSKKSPLNKCCLLNLKKFPSFFVMAAMPFLCRGFFSNYTIELYARLYYWQISFFLFIRKQIFILYEWARL